MNAEQITQALAVVILPWSIKPLYGLITDLFPIAGYRRRSYLLLMTGLACAAYACLAFCAKVPLIAAVLTLSALGVAFGDVIVDALMVENGQRTGQVRRFQSVQWTWVSVAGMLASLVGGYLAQHFAPLTALRIAALLPLPFFALLAVLALRVPEERVPLSRAQTLQSARGLFAALKNKTLWKTAAVLALLSFMPSVGTPFFFHLTDTLKISQAAIGVAGAIGSAGAVVGALLFHRFFASRFGQRALLGCLLVASAAATLLYLCITNAATLYAAAALMGIIGIMANLGILSIAGEACPKRAEGFAFAALMGLTNLAHKGGDLIGAKLFTALHNQFAPLVWISASTTLLCLALVPLMPKGEKEGQIQPI